MDSLTAGILGTKAIDKDRCSGSETGSHLVPDNQSEHSQCPSLARHDTASSESSRQWALMYSNFSSHSTFVALAAIQKNRRQRKNYLLGVLLVIDHSPHCEKSIASHDACSGSITIDKIKRLARAL